MDTFLNYILLTQSLWNISQNWKLKNGVEFSVKFILLESSTPILVSYKRSRFVDYVATVMGISVLRLTQHESNLMLLFVYYYIIVKDSIKNSVEYNVGPREQSNIELIYTQSGNLKRMYFCDRQIPSDFPKQSFKANHGAGLNSAFDR